MPISIKIFKKALSRVLTLPNCSTGPEPLIYSRMLALQNNEFSKRCIENQAECDKEAVTETVELVLYVCDA